MSPPSAKAFDALVIGGGPGGATAALLLAEAGWSVVLAERKVFPRRKVCGEYLSATNWPLLEMLGLAEAFAEMAGPPVTRTAIFVGGSSVQADLPRPFLRARSSSDEPWGRALSREHLDSLLLARAVSRGVDVRQPWRCAELTRDGDGYVCRIESQETRQSSELRACLVIAAHGSWELGPLVTQPQQVASRPDDLLAFKAHFREAALPLGLMPLLSFADGYGGMVHCDHGQVSLSCCLRRGRLERLPRADGETAGEAVLQHILDSCPVLRPVLDRAIRDEPWLSAGPIRPGLRPCYRDGVFVVGNAAGEAHPVVAEGISMAVQSAWLLTRRLIAARTQLHERRVADEVGRRYEADWRRCFAPRIRAAAAVAHWAMHPKLVAATIPFVRRWPGLLTWGARLSGKARLVIHEAVPAS
ncbi:MAG: FAD-dependent monooxygenase [Planctomycetota bacterium]